MHEGEIKLMTLSEGVNRGIKCGLTSRYFKRISRIPSKEDIIPEIEKLKPDVVLIDLNLYDRIGGIDTLNMIRDRLDVNAWFE
jgi:AmiR/NasT family two-component response regulator